MNDGHGATFGVCRTKSGVSASFTFFIAKPNDLINLIVQRYAGD
jgi:hypothetical protein